MRMGQRSLRNILCGLLSLHIHVRGLLSTALLHELSLRMQRRWIGLPGLARVWLCWRLRLLMLHVWWLYCI